MDWKLDPVDGYSHKVVYNILPHFNHRPTNVHSDIIWNKYVPFKVSFCMETY